MFTAKLISKHLLPSLVAAGIALYAADAAAFSEDLCAKSDASGRTWVADCLGSAACAPGSSHTAACRVNVMWDAGVATGSGKGRSMLHTDASYVIAQAVGFRWDIAYWIAAYDETTDLGEYVPFDQCGAPIGDTSLHAAPINGFQRTDPSHGGFGYHFVTAFSARGDGSDLAGTSGLHPDLGDDLHEGMLTQLRRWAFPAAASSAVMCVNGFTSRLPMSGAPYLNASCYDPLPGSGSRLISGEVPLFTAGGTRIPFSAYNGDQYLMTAGGNEYYYDDLPTLLASATGKLQEGSDAGQPVPPVLAKMGIYLHVLQDRISHHQCGDVSYVKWDSPQYRYRYEANTSSPTKCTQDQHAWGHYEELAQNAPLPDRTYSALDYTYGELQQLAAALHGSKPEWFTARYATPISKANLIGTRSAPGSLARTLMVSGGPMRVASELALISANGLTQLPGHSTSGVCR